MTIEKANQIVENSPAPYTAKLWEKYGKVRVYITIPYTFFRNGMPQPKEFNVYIENGKMFSQNLSKSLFPELTAYMKSAGIEDMPII